MSSGASASSLNQVLIDNSQAKRSSFVDVAASRAKEAARALFAPLQLCLPGNWAYFICYLPYLARTVPWHGHHQEEQEEAPDYEDLSNWSSHPLRPRGARDLEDANFIGLEGGKEPPEPSQRPCDLFFLHDSCVIPDAILPFLGQNDRLGSGPRRWNARLRGGPPGSRGALFAAKVNEQVDLRVTVAAPAFNELCRIYAPRYRQATVTAYVHGRGMPLPAHRTLECCYGGPVCGTKLGVRTGDADRAFDFAYMDLRAAFVRFVDDPNNADRPFFLASHSQGSLHCVRLLQEEVEPYPARRKRFVHAYIAGWCVPTELFGRTLHNIKPSSTPGDICSVSSWRTAAPFHCDWLGMVCSRGATYFSDTGWSKTKWPVHATNPLSWTPSSELAVADEEVRVSVYPAFEGMDPRHHVNSISCSSGVGLRFGHVMSTSRGLLGLRAKSLRRVDTGRLTARLDKHGVNRVPSVPVDSVFYLCEGDYLLYHDIDFALFYGSVRRNVATRFEAWSRFQADSSRACFRRKAAA